MGLYELSCQISEEAKRLRAELEDLRLLKSTQTLTQPTKSIESTLGRVEGRLIEVHENTNKLMERIPDNLMDLLGEIRTLVLERIESLKMAPTQSNQSRRLDSAVWLKESLGRLTCQERRLFQICFSSGLLSYRELSEQLDITPTSAKNIVNRLFKDNNKRKLFQKKHHHGIARIEVPEAVKERILRGNSKTYSSYDEHRQPKAKISS
jgi:hypothetical protein